MVRTGRLRTSDRRTRLLRTGAKQRGEQVPESFTALYSQLVAVVYSVGSAAGCRPFPTCYRSHKLLGRSRGHGRDLERRQFSPVKTEVISIPLEDKEAPAGRPPPCPEFPGTMEWSTGRVVPGPGGRFVSVLPPQGADYNFPGLRFCDYNFLNGCMS